MNAWPMGAEYEAALQNLSIAFPKRADLKKSTIETLPGSKRPFGRSGQFAIVYQATLPGGERRALRTFSSERPEVSSRYRAISDFLQQRKLKSLVHFEYMDKGIRVADKVGQLRTYPLVLMEWVEGDSLFAWVQEQCQKSNGHGLRTAADRWIDVVEELFAAQISHGDLQHGNIMVQPSGDFKFVDYDCMCVPALVGRNNLEIGVKPYQHPARDAHTKLSPDLDNFSAIFIMVALRALAASPALWREYVEKPNYDKLLFQESDFLDPSRSSLLQALAGSSDPDVRRWTKDLVDLYRGPMHAVPPLRAMLFSYARVESLLNARDFDAAIEMLDRKGSTSDAPAALAPQISNARNRVDCRKKLEACIDAGDEQCMANTYDPKLLDDYPRAQASVQTARPARQVLKLKSELEAIRQKSQWRELVKAWDAQRAILDSRKSVQALKREVDNWRERHRLCDEVRRLRKLSTGGGVELQRAWLELQRLGGHPDVTGKERADIELQVQRTADLAAHRAVVAASPVPSEAGDRKVVASWAKHVPTLAIWPAAAAEGRGVAEAAERLKIVDELTELVGKKASIPGDMAIEKLSARVPTGYVYDSQSLVEKAVNRRTALLDLTKALQLPQSDTLMCDATRRLKLVDGLQFIPDDIVPRIVLADKRVPLLQQLKAIPAKSKPDQYDRLILKIWDAKLLDACDEAAPWRARYDDAVHRRSLLEQIERAFREKQPAKLVELAADERLRDYPMPAELRREFARAQESVRVAKALLTALETDDADAIYESFSARMIRENASLFEQHRDRLRSWIKRRLFNHSSDGLSPPQFGDAVVSSNGKGTPQCIVRWKWPRAAHEGQCLLGICKRPPTASATPDQADMVEQRAYDRKRYEDAGGRAVIHTNPAMRGCSLVVWATIDLGFEKFYSDPVVLGKVPR